MSPADLPARVPAPAALLERLRRRHQAIWALRSHLVAQGFWELDTAQLTPGPGLEPHLDPLAVPVKTSFEGPPSTRWLVTSPELSLKRCLALGAQRVFQLGHVFRDGERTARHCPEFTLLEHYRAPGTLAQVMGDVEELVEVAARALGVAAPPRPYARATVAELFSRHAGIDLGAMVRAHAQGDGDALVRAARGAGVQLRPGADFGDAFAGVMDQRVEPALPRERPTVVSRWPAPMAALARRCDDDALFAERFEIYGFTPNAPPDARPLELCNAFDELTDAVEQRARFLDDNEQRRALGKPALPLDEDFLAALPSLPRSAGCALGVDRLLMLLLGAAHLDEVTALPWR
ncbi:MAG: hypothetical protein A2138_09250 [Deltaproteobacteria bacterium RBG_16_71_12]|nr:MAG: hypothetical protein A2138_09250 [Deltaproteobacteria bacterium RBG_16_71_12]